MRNQEDDGYLSDSVAGSSCGSSCSSGGDSESPRLQKTKEQPAHPTQLEEQVVIAKSETTTVKRLKLIVLAVLCLSAVGVALAVYFFTSGSEQVQFQAAFQGHSTKVLEGVGTSLERTLGALDAFQTNLVSWAREVNQTWPFVTSQDFAIRASKLRLLSDAILLSVNPLVTKEQRLDWEAYALQNQGWVNESMKVQETDQFYYGPINYNHSINEVIHTDFGDVPYNTSQMLPTWQSSPIVSRFPPFGWDYLSAVIDPVPILRCMDERKVTMSVTYNLPDMNIPDEVAAYEFWKDWYKDYIPSDKDPGEPMNDIYYPILDSAMTSVQTVDNATIVGMLSASFYWRDLIQDLLPSGSDGVVAVFKSECSPAFTYQINGPNAVYLGRGDHHEPKFDSVGQKSSLYDLSSFFIGKSRYTGVPMDQELCPMTIHVYPSTTMQVKYITTQPVSFTVGAVLIFVCTSAVFLLYDFYVELRQRKVMTTAARTNAIVSSLFPSVVRDRLFQKEEEPKDPVLKLGNAKNRLKSFVMESNSEGVEVRDSEATPSTSGSDAPIADLFPDATVFFADLAGFTAWSSSRQPTQVFTLLETLYGAFDTIARKRGVFKIETIGDCYVAVCGLPEPRADHAVAMVRFAHDCRVKMSELTRNLETTLGPDTGDLKLRIGLNSGPVTAGVLRGERARFQLFGDTVNCAARMESNGKPSMIHVSQKTADLLCEAGKQHWVIKRDGLIEAKGKGKMQTYWIEPQRGNLSAQNVEAIPETITSKAEAHPMLGISWSDEKSMHDKTARLIDWNVEAFEGLVRRIIVARRVNTSQVQQPPPPPPGRVIADPEPMIAPRSEISEVIMLPSDLEHKPHIDETELAQVELSPSVAWQLRGFITAIAHMYRPNAFHNFEHASHVVMSTMQHLQRVTKYGIASDPLTHFAIVFAALIHNVDHPGVSNEQLVAEQDPLARLYENQSVAEQNSLAIAWQLLMEPLYSDLRVTLFAHIDELQRFRRLVVNCIMATDMMDEKLKVMRDAQWVKAFPSNVDANADFVDVYHDSRQATAVMEHLIQASHVAHSMQHWAIYQKWNKRLFQEMFVAFRSGRTRHDPAVGWYKGELLFFDNYIIPLATKLKECRVFGDSYDEFLTHAVDNRSEWEAKGETIVSDLVQQQMEDLLLPTNTETKQPPLPPPPRDPEYLLEI